jgi:hypothetical protein
MVGGTKSLCDVLKMRGVQLARYFESDDPDLKRQ